MTARSSQRRLAATTASASAVSAQGVRTSAVVESGVSRVMSAAYHDGLLIADASGADMTHCLMRIVRAPGISWLAMVLVPIAHAVYDPAREYVEGPAVAPPLPDPPLRTPA